MRTPDRKTLENRRLWPVDGKIPPGAAGPGPLLIRHVRGSALRHPPQQQRPLHIRDGVELS